MPAIPSSRWWRKAGSGEESLEKAKTQSPDLVTVDINLPGVDGFELTRILKKRYPAVRVIIISINGNPVFRREAERLNCPYIPKESLLAELPAVLHGLTRLIHET